MLLRLIPALGGDETTYGIIAMNDTGSDMPTISTTDLLQLGNIQGYVGWHGVTSVMDATGSITVYPRIRI